MINAFNGGRPKATNIGATSATGVPNPAAPSKKRPKNQATRIAAICGLDETEESQPPISSIAPVLVWYS